jgi:uncharacterized protein (DUF305 family)
VRPRLAIATIAAIATLTAAACSSDDHGDMDMGSGDDMPGSSMPHDDMGDGMAGSGSTSTISVPADAAFNAMDVAFAQGMIPHHAQAVEMAEMALAISTDPTVRALAEKVKAAQDPEITLMTSWLEAWGQSVPDRNGPMGHDGTGPGGMMMSGMMSEAEMAQLGAARGGEFDRMFLEMMIRHHEGAVQMAQQQLADGKYPPAKDLARAIMAAQQAEIDQMRALLSPAT